MPNAWQASHLEAARNLHNLFTHMHTYWTNKGRRNMCEETADQIGFTADETDTEVG